MLDRLSPRPGARHRSKRIGRGPGTGFGKTGGRGMKGQGKRSAGRQTPVWFEGGQMPLVRRLPKRGFTNIHRKRVEIVNLRDLARFGDGATIDVAILAASGLVGGSGCQRMSQVHQPGHRPIHTELVGAVSVEVSAEWFITNVSELEGIIGSA